MSHDCDDAARRLLADAEAAARGVARRRAVAIVDLFLPEAERPSDLQRATVTRLLDGLIDAIEAGLRAALPPITAGDVKARLRAARLLEDETLIAVLLRRADAERLARGLPVDAALLDGLAGDGDAAVAAAATSLKKSALRDRFGDALIAPADLPRPVLGKLLWTVAAALRDGLDGPDADARLGAAGEALLTRIAGEAGEMACAVRLAAALDAAGRLDDAMILNAVAAGELAIAVAALARRAHLGTATVWEMLAYGDRLLVLLAAVGMPRTEALGIASLLCPGEELAARATAFDRLTPAAAEAGIAPWRLHPNYRAARAALERAP